MPRTDRGFTLIELLIVVVIIGILASIAIPKFSSVREKAYVSAMKADLKNLATQQEVYYNLSFVFASTLTAVQATTSEGISLTINEATGTGWLPDAEATYIADGALREVMTDSRPEPTTSFDSDARFTLY